MDAEQRRQAAVVTQQQAAAVTQPQVVAVEPPQQVQRQPQVEVDAAARPQQPDQLTPWSSDSRQLVSS